MVFFENKGTEHRGVDFGSWPFCHRVSGQKLGLKRTRLKERFNAEFLGTFGEQFLLHFYLKLLTCI